MTRYRRKGKSLDFLGKTEFVDTIHAQEKNYTKKNVHQDIFPKTIKKQKICAE